MPDFDLLSIPEHLIVEVLKKVQVRKFLDFLRSCRYLNSLAYGSEAALKFTLEKQTLHLYFDRVVNPEDTVEFLIKTKIFPSDQLYQTGFTHSINGVHRLNDFLERLTHFGFFNFSSICISEQIKNPEAEAAVVQTLEKMRQYRMRASDLEMYNTEICNLAVDVLKPSYFRSDFQIGKNLAECITEQTLAKIDYLDYFSDNDTDAQMVMSHVLPNCPYLDACYDFQCDWIWKSILETVKKIRCGTVINKRLCLSVFDTDLPDFSEYFKDIPHKSYKHQCDDHYIVTIFIDCLNGTSKIAMLTKTNMLCESFHYQVVENFEEFKDFYCEVLKLEEYEYCPEVESEVFGENKL